MTRIMTEYSSGIGPLISPKTPGKPVLYRKDKLKFAVIQMGIGRLI